MHDSFDCDTTYMFRLAFGIDSGMYYFGCVLLWLIIGLAIIMIGWMY